MYEENVMNINRKITCLIPALLLAACNMVANQSGEVTSLMTQSTDTALALAQPTGHQESLTLTSTPNITDSSLPITIQTETVSVQIDPVYFDGIVVLVQYYMFLDQGLYEKAVSLYCVSKQNINGIEADVDYFKSSLESVEIRSIFPYDYWLAQQGMDPLPTPQHEIRFVVKTTVVFKGAAWNDHETPVPYDRSSFVSLIWEKNEWKIYEINSSPWYP